MNLRFVEAFYWVATLRSASRAAEKLFITQSAMSSRIAALEDELGVLLLDRRDKQFRLTVAGAAFLTLAMAFIGLPRHLAEFIGALNLSPFALMLMLVAFYVVLGCFLDGISMVVLTMAVLLPTVQKAGFDLIWFGIFVVLVVELAQITPPVGFNLFLLQGLTKRDITWIARRSMPLFALMLAFVLLLWFVPGLATWMPSHM